MIDIDTHKRTRGILIDNSVPMWDIYDTVLTQSRLSAALKVHILNREACYIAGVPVLVYKDGGEGYDNSVPTCMDAYSEGRIRGNVYIIGRIGDDIPRSLTGSELDILMNAISLCIYTVSDRPVKNIYCIQPTSDTLDITIIDG